MANTYLVFNGPMATTAAPTSVTTGTSLKTLIQLKPATETPLKIIGWGISFDGSAAATPGKVELIETDVAATVTAFAAADVQKFSNGNAPTNTAGTSGIPLNLGTSASGYTSSAEGTTTASRMFDLQLVSPTVGYSTLFPLGREPEILSGKFLRVRVTFAAAINALCWVAVEV